MDGLNRWYTGFLVLIVAFSTAAAAIAAAQRVQVEEANRGVEIAVDYTQVREIARREQAGLDQVLHRFKEAGVTSLLIKEQLPADLVNTGSAYVQSAMELADRGVTNIKPGYIYFICHPEVFDRVRKNLTAKVPGAHSIEDNSAGLFLVGVPLPLETLTANGIGLGFPQEGIRAADNVGLNIIPQVRSWPESEKNSVKIVFDEIAEMDNLSVMAFNDPEIPGFPYLLPELEKHMEKLDVPTAVVEFFPQVGLKNLIYATGKNAVRLHSVSPEEMASMSADRALDRYVLAVNERNVRVLLVRFFQPLGSPSWLEDNVQFIRTLREELVSRQFVLGRASSFEGFSVSSAHAGLIGLGVIAAGMLLLEQVRRRRFALVIGAAALAGWGILLLWDFDLARKLMGLSAVTIFPTLGVTAMSETRGSSPIRCIGRLMGMSAASLAGAVIMVGLFAGKGYLLKLDQFTGVKAGMLVPLALIPIFLILKHDARIIKTVREFLDSVVQYKWLILLGVLGLAVLVLLVRSGNDTGLVTDLEVRFRSLLNQLLLIRPRTKEFLIGHPFMLLALYLGYSNRSLSIILLGAVGQVSLVNTFEHFHTPLAVSALRTVHGLWIGIVFGLALIFAYRIVMYFWENAGGGPDRITDSSSGV